METENQADKNKPQNPPDLQATGRPLIYQQDIAPNTIKQQHLQASPTRAGDIYYGKDGVSFSSVAIGTAGSLLNVSSGIPSWLPPGSANQVLSISGGIPTWSAPTNPDPLIADALNARTTNHITITPGASKFVKVAVLEQDSTTNNYRNNTVILTGWTFVTGDGVGSDFSKAITFGITFTTPAIVVVGQLGLKDTSDPTSITDFGAVPGALACGAASITTSGFSATLGLSVVSTNNRRYGMSWIAIGTL